MFDIGVSTIQGARDYQEDSFVITDPFGSNKGFDDLNDIMLLVADGVGGEAAGNVASQIAGSASAKYIQTILNQDHSVQAIKSMLLTVGLAVNTKINDSIKGCPENKGMATTLVLCLIVNQQLRWVSMGDSHLYLMRGLTLHKLNENHSYGALLDQRVAEGNLSQYDAINHPDRNCLLSYLDGGEIKAIDTPDKALDLQSGDVIILASDGLDTLSNKEIIQIINREAHAQDTAVALTDCVMQAKVAGQDNTTVIVTRVKDLRSLG